jgi:hypothetical protein
VGQERLGPSYFFISLVLGPLHSLAWYVPSSRYIWSLAPIFCFCKNKSNNVNPCVVFFTLFLRSFILLRELENVGPPRLGP